MLPEGGIYIAGKMRGEPDGGFPKFFDAESFLLATTDNYPIFNPARNDVEVTGIEFRGVTEFDGGFDLEAAMKADLDFIASDDCACVVVLDNWAGSEGTFEEIELALFLGKPVYFLRRHNGTFWLWPYATDEDWAWYVAR